MLKFPIDAINSDISALVFIDVEKSFEYFLAIDVDSVVIYK